MKNMLAASVASFVFVTLTGSAIAAETMTPKAIVDGEKVTVTAVVESIDRTSRTVMLKGPEGNLVELTVDPSVTRFDNLKVGDHVTTTYNESVAFNIQKPGTPMQPDSITTQAGKYTGAKPGGGVTDTTVATVTIVKIDKAAPSVTFRTSDGAVKTVTPKHPERLNDIKVGDVVVVTKTKGLMIEVQPAP
jgi:hypothetical protein